LQNNNHQPHDAITPQYVRSWDLREVFSRLYDLQTRKDVDGELLAAAMRRLIDCEVEPGGPYYSQPGVLDPAANLMIARFLRLHDVTLPGLEAYLARKGAAVASKSQVVLKALDRVDPMPEKPYKAVTDAVYDRLKTLPVSLRQPVMTVFEKLQIADTNHEIALMPQFFAESLIYQNPLKRSDMTLLGAANFLNWMATIIYDDFIDEEGQPELLPVANVTNRLSLQLYNEVVRHDMAAMRQVETWYTVVDQANAWEVQHTRMRVASDIITLTALPRYGNRHLLAQRALGHVVGPLLIARSIPDANTAQTRQIAAALNQYLIARQINDDLHDWRKDVQAGQISAVVADMLRQAHIITGQYTLNILVPKFERYFLKTGVQRTCTLLLSHVLRSRVAMQESRLMTNSGGFNKLLDDLEASAHQAIALQKNEQEFLRAFSEKPQDAS